MQIEQEGNRILFHCVHFAICNGHFAICNPVCPPSSARRDMLKPAIIAAWCLTVAAATGCRIPGYDGPISQSLANSRQLSRRGVAALERGQPHEAEQLLAKAVKSCPADCEARRNYAEALWQRGGRQEAVAQLREAVRRVDDDAALHERLAEMYLELGQLDAARQSADRAIELNPKAAGPWATRGRVHCAAGQLRDALADCHRALGYASDDRAILRNIADLYRRLNEPQRALQTLQNLAETYTPGEEPQDVLASIGMAQLALQRFGDAAETLSAAATRGQPNAEVYCRWAEAEWFCGRADNAAAAAARAWNSTRATRPAASCSHGSNWPVSRKARCDRSTATARVMVSGVASFSRTPRPRAIG